MNTGASYQRLRKSLKNMKNKTKTLGLKFPGVFFAQEN